MSLLQTKFKPWIRVIAIATLFAWLGALVFCKAGRCSGNEHHSGSADQHQADAAPCCHSHQQNRGNAPVSKHECSFCLSLKSVEHSSSAISISKAAFQPLYELTFAPTPPANTQVPSIVLRFRQARPSEWVLTPEVCLVPAFRSLAPPSVPVA